MGQSNIVWVIAICPPQNNLRCLVRNCPDHFSGYLNWTVYSLCSVFSTHIAAMHDWKKRHQTWRRREKRKGQFPCAHLLLISPLKLYPLWWCCLRVGRYFQLGLCTRQDHPGIGWNFHQDHIIQVPTVCSWVEAMKCGTLIYILLRAPSPEQINGNWTQNSWNWWLAGGADALLNGTPFPSFDLLWLQST